MLSPAFLFITTAVHISGNLPNGRSKQRPYEENFLPRSGYPYEENSANREIGVPGRLRLAIEGGDHQVGAHARVHPIAQGVAEEIEGQDGGHHRERGKKDEMRRVK